MIWRIPRGLLMCFPDSGDRTAIVQVGGVASAPRPVPPVSSCPSPHLGSLSQQHLAQQRGNNDHRAIVERPLFVAPRAAAAGPGARGRCARCPGDARAGGRSVNYNPCPRCCDRGASGAACGRPGAARGSRRAPARAARARGAARASARQRGPARARRRRGAASSCARHDCAQAPRPPGGRLAARSVALRRRAPAACRWARTTGPPMQAVRASSPATAWRTAPGPGGDLTSRRVASGRTGRGMRPEGTRPGAIPRGHSAPRCADP